jgi:hypothetical protein
LVIIGDGVGILLRVERTPQDQSQAAIRGLDNVCDLVYRVTTIEGVLMGEPVFDDVRECDACIEGFGDARKKCGVHKGRTVRILDRGGR